MPCLGQVGADRHQNSSSQPPQTSQLTAQGFPLLGLWAGMMVLCSALKQRGDAQRGTTGDSKLPQSERQLRLPTPLSEHHEANLARPRASSGDPTLGHSEQTKRCTQLGAELLTGTAQRCPSALLPCGITGTAAQRKGREGRPSRLSVLKKSGASLGSRRSGGRSRWDFQGAVQRGWPGGTVGGRQGCTLTLETHPRETPL